MKKVRRARVYRMKARAEAAADTHHRIVQTAIRQFGARYYDEVSLADIAREAGVTVQTVLRRFGSKDGLCEAAAARGAEEVRRDRMNTAAGNLDAAVHSLALHYEAWGDRSLRFLAQEQRVAAMRRVTDAGRALHYEWVEHAFSPWLAKERGARRVRLRARLIAATDVYVWKLLRRDLGFGTRAFEVTVRELVAAVVA